MTAVVKQPTIIGGHVLSIPAYYTGQNTNGSPDHYVSKVEAQRLKSRRTARSIHRGTALLITGIRPLTDATRESVKKAWKVVGQTAKKKPSRPGFPHYGSI